jgi:hypothetical protein
MYVVQLRENPRGKVLGTQGPYPSVKAARTAAQPIADAYPGKAVTIKNAGKKRAKRRNGVYDGLSGWSGGPNPPYTVEVIDTVNDKYVQQLRGGNTQAEALAVARKQAAKYHATKAGFDRYIVQIVGEYSGHRSAAWTEGAGHGGAWTEGVGHGGLVVGDRVRMRADHWTGIGARSGVLESLSLYRAFVRFDDGTLIEVDTRAIEKEPRKNTGSRKRNAPLKAAQAVWDSLDRGVMPDIDAHAVTELVLYADNEYALYQQRQLIAANLAKKRAKGTYDWKKAPQGFMHLADSAAKAYTKEFGEGKGFGIFDAQTRAAAAYQWARQEAAGEFRENKGRSRQGVGPRQRTNGREHYQGHVINAQGGVFTVEPYNQQFKTLAGAKKWLDQHVASSSAYRYNPMTTSLPLAIYTLDGIRLAAAPPLEESDHAIRLAEKFADDRVETVVIRGPDGRDLRTVLPRPRTGLEPPPW